MRDETQFRDDQAIFAAQTTSVVADPIAAGHRSGDPQAHNAGGDHLRDGQLSRVVQANHAVASTIAASHASPDAHRNHDDSDPLAADQIRGDAQSSSVGGDPIDGGLGYDAAHHPPAAVERHSGGRARSDAQRRGVAASSLTDSGHEIAETHTISAAVGEIIELWRHRQAWHRAEKSLTLQAKAICRRFCGGDKKAAAELFAAESKGTADTQPSAVAAAISPLLEARTIIEANRKAHEKRMTKLARTLPIWPWADATRGIDAKALCSLIGECGDLSNYATVSRLWKRLGLAVIDGGRQRRVSGIDALVHGYSPARRSVAWNVGACLIRSGNEHYREIYLARKAYETPRVATKAHAHNRAARYMTKRFLRDLWIEWRRAIAGMEPNLPLPAADSSAAEPEAFLSVNMTMPAAEPELAGAIERLTPKTTMPPPPKSAETRKPLSPISGLSQPPRSARSKRRVHPDPSLTEPTPSPAEGAAGAVRRLHPTRSMPRPKSRKKAIPA